MLKLTTMLQALSGLQILVIAAHPDDEALGCGGTIARLSKDNDVYLLVMNKGIQSRGDDEEAEARNYNAMMRSAEILGIKKVFNFNFPDNKYDSIPLLEFAKAIESVKINPDIVFTHYEHDLNIDHRIVYQATMTAFRPQPGQSCKMILSYEVLSSTEWQRTPFNPDVFITLNEVEMDIKYKSLLCYNSEMRDAPHTRSFINVENLTAFRGFSIGSVYAESFQLIRLIL